MLEKDKSVQTKDAKMRKDKKVAMKMKTAARFKEKEVLCEDISTKREEIGANKKMKVKPEEKKSTTIDYEQKMRLKDEIDFKNQTAEISLNNVKTQVCLDETEIVKNGCRMKSRYLKNK